MSFMYPLGLIGLIGIPIVIIIYILRSKYNEQTISSVYLWRLSEKFLKRRNPLSGITGIISLILQILTITVISLAIAHPVFVLPNAAHDYYFILDSSSSMNMESGKDTRFELAKDEITKVIKSAADGSSYSLVSVSDKAERVFDGVTDKRSARELVDALTPGNTHGESADLIRAAQDCFDGDPSGYIYVITDKSYSSTQNVNVITVGESGENYAIFDSAYSHSGGKLKVSASVVSYESDAVVNVELLLNGELAASTEVSVKKGESVPVSLECAALTFSSFTVRVTNDDIYLLDNELTTYNLKSEKTYSTLIVSDGGFFFKAAIDALVDSEVDIVSPEEYEKLDGEYGLYIFDCYEPESLPDAAVWLINPDRSIDDAGFGIRGKIDLGEAVPIEKSKSTSTSVRTLLDGVEGEDIYIKNYVKYSGMYLDFSTLFSIDGNPIIFAGANGLGNRQVVFGFDINESDIALSYDFVMLLGNLIDYSFPNVIDKTNFTAGDVATVNTVTGAENMKAYSPSGKEIYLGYDGAMSALSLDEVGVYTVSMTIADKENTYRIYSGAHKDESSPVEHEESLELSGVPGGELRDGEYDPLTILFICLAVLFIADWGVYCYEKYQLR
ncbi:MAG: VWA domain-containing protein [Clostridia bacterium]|nr:VWA domain-containing protein [Clostridia bacterium]